MKHEEKLNFSFSEATLLEKAPEFYGNLQKSCRRAKKSDPPVYDVIEKPNLFEAILHWIDHGVVMKRPYLASFELETYYLDLYRLAVEFYELPGLSNAIIDALHDWHSGGGILLEMVDEAYGMTDAGDGLRRLYFDCLLAMSSDEFEGMTIENSDVSIDLFEAAKMAFDGHRVQGKEAYHTD